MNSRILLDSNFMDNITNNEIFRENGFYSGSDSGINFTVIDPKLHNMEVWVKRKQNSLNSTLKKSLNHKYRTTAKSLGAFVFTNGPFMTPRGPINLINSVVSAATFIPCKIASFLGYSPSQKNWGLYIAYIIPYWPWKPFGTVVHNGTILDYGQPPNSPWFGRIGTGSFADYTIQNGVPNNAIDGIVGHPVIRCGKIINPTQDSWASRASAICCWGLIPYRTHTAGKISKSSDNDKKSGVILVMGSNTNTGSIPQKMVDVGVVDAIGVDGGTSALMGERKNTFFECKWYKDKIQKYGLFCSLEKNKSNRY
jgi:hypothetical protein